MDPLKLQASGPYCPTCDISPYGLYPVPTDLTPLLPPPGTQAPTGLPITGLSFFEIPKVNTSLTATVYNYAKKNLSKPQLNHALRTYYLGQAIVVQQFPRWRGLYSDEALFCAAMLHYVGWERTTTTTDTRNFIDGEGPDTYTYTGLSAELAAGILAWEVLHHFSAPPDLITTVTESILRQREGEERIFHPYLLQPPPISPIDEWDLLSPPSGKVTGNIPVLCQILQMGMWLDDVGWLGEWIHRETVERVVREFPRMGWTEILVGLVEKESKLKPWGSAGRCVGREEWVMRVRGNRVMERFEEVGEDEGGVKRI